MRWCAIAAIALSLACSPAHNGASSSKDPVVDPLVPAPDSVGPAPKSFSWRPVPGAASYAVGLWNESDALVWRADDITATSTLIPEEFKFEPGTYFWSISALREDNQIAESGLAAFVVRTIP